MLSDAEPWLSALLTSRMHMAGSEAVGGKLRNTVSLLECAGLQAAVPHLLTRVEEPHASIAFRVLDVREYHCEYTLAELYDTEKMPENLRQATWT